MRIAAIADLHHGKKPEESTQSLLAEVAGKADVLALCGDLTDMGLPEEANALAKELTIVKIPCVAVFGNHDFESGKQDEVRSILEDAGIKILDGESLEIDGVGFAGTKGFPGGFDQGVLQPWGEDSIKKFVQEAVNEGLKLEGALSKLRTPQRIALLHYSPVSATIQGEPPEIHPFLGSSRLEEPITRFKVSAVFHGHAHRGQLQGKTRTDVPVFNVSMRVLQRLYPDRPPFYLFELQPDHLMISS